LFSCAVVAVASIVPASSTAIRVAIVVIDLVSPPYGLECDLG
jgi:hypothetical protein